MSIGRTSDRKAIGHEQTCATGLRFEKQELIVSLADGREVAVPLHLYPSLLHASQRQRESWELIGPGKGFHWEELDLDLSVDGLVQGLAEAIPCPLGRPRN